MTPFAQKLLLSAVFVAGAFAALLWSAHTNKSNPLPVETSPIACRAVQTDSGIVAVVIGDSVK